MRTKGLSPLTTPTPTPPDRTWSADRPEAPSEPRPRRLPRLDRQEITAIFVGGGCGTLGRAALGELVPHSPTSWPWATFVVNVVACLLLGYFVTRLQERLPLSSYRRPLVGTGFCGGLSTFSTMQIELLKMLDAHAYWLAIGYASGSVVAGFFGVYLATASSRRVRVLR